MVLVGAITGAHGVQGEVKVKSFTAVPASITAYGPLYDESGTRRFDLNLTAKGNDAADRSGPDRAGKGLLIGRIAGIADRDMAEALKGQRLFVPRAQLPASEDPEEFYLTDLIGLAVRDRDGGILGKVVDVVNHGAGDVLMVEGGPMGAFDVPFAHAFVPEVDLAAGYLVADLPADFFELPEKEGRPESEAGADDTDAGIATADETSGSGTPGR